MYDTNSFNKILSELIREKRKEQRYSQEQLAEGAELHTTTVSRIETGVHSPKIENILSICNFLGIKVSELMAQVEEKLI